MIETLYRDHYQRLLRYCLSLTHSLAFAEDIVQEAFLRALAHADVLIALPEAKCLAWLYKTARNLFIDQARRLAKAPRIASGEVFEADLTCVQAAQMMDLLPKQERDLSSLRYFRGYNATELGSMLGLPPSTVRARLMEARKRLKAHLQNEQKE